MAMATAARRFLQTLVANRSSCSYNYGVISRSIASSPRLEESMGWFDKIKSAVTGKGTDPKPESFSLIGNTNTPLMWSKAEIVPFLSQFLRISSTRALNSCI